VRQSCTFSKFPSSHTQLARYCANKLLVHDHGRTRTAPKQNAFGDQLPAKA